MLYKILLKSVLKIVDEDSLRKYLEENRIRYFSEVCVRYKRNIYLKDNFPDTLVTVKL